MLIKEIEKLKNINDHVRAENSKLRDFKPVYESITTKFPGEDINGILMNYQLQKDQIIDLKDLLDQEEDKCKNNKKSHRKDVRVL